MNKIKLSLKTVDVESFDVLPASVDGRTGTVRAHGDTWDPPTCMASCGYTWCNDVTCAGQFSCADTCTETRPVRSCPSALCP